jgi:Recombinase
MQPVRRPLTRSRRACCQIIRQIQKSGVSSLRGVAKALSARGVKTARSGEWTAVQVSHILRRA